MPIINSNSKELSSVMGRKNKNLKLRVYQYIHFIFLLLLLQYKTLLERFVRGLDVLWKYNTSVDIYTRVLSIFILHTFYDTIQTPLCSFFLRRIPLLSISLTNRLDRDITEVVI